ncbi:uncharacterized [Tachysurus ichikawai]
MPGSIPEGREKLPSSIRPGNESHSVSDTELTLTDERGRPQKQKPQAFTSTIDCQDGATRQDAPAMFVGFYVHMSVKSSVWDSVNSIKAALRYSEFTPCETPKATAAPA